VCCVIELILYTVKDELYNAVLSPKDKTVKFTVLSFGERTLEKPKNASIILVRKPEGEETEWETTPGSEDDNKVGLVWMHLTRKG
jgi:hypothetical protein